MKFVGVPTPFLEDVLKVRGVSSDSEIKFGLVNEWLNEFLVINIRDALHLT